MVPGNPTQAGKEPKVFVGVQFAHETVVLDAVAEVWLPLMRGGKETQRLNKYKQLSYT